MSLRRENIWIVNVGHVLPFLAARILSHSRR